MLSALPLWIPLNVYAFLLDALALAGGAGAWALFSSGCPVWGGAAAFAAAALLFAAIRVHLSYPAKLKAYHTLCLRNRDTLRIASLVDFMGSPCYRMVVRMVLYRVGHPEAYKVVYREFWGSGMPCFSPRLSTVTIFKDAEEGANWLKAHSRHFDSPDNDSPFSAPDASGNNDPQ